MKGEFPGQTTMSSGLSCDLNLLPPPLLPKKNGTGPFWTCMVGAQLNLYFADYTPSRHQLGVGWGVAQVVHYHPNGYPATHIQKTAC